MITNFEAYKIFLSLKMHFTSPGYDFFRYNGKVKATIQSFERRKDKFQFAKLAKHKDPIGYLVSQIVAGNFCGWVGDLFGDEQNQIYTDYLQRHQSLTYIFQNDLNLLQENFIDKFRARDGQHPELLVMFKQGKISPETLTILDDVLKFFPVWDTKIDETILWPSIRDRLVKYRPFVKYDRKKIKDIIKNVLEQ